VTIRSWRMRKNFNKTGESPAKKMPQRTCVACREIKAKRQLLRIVGKGEGDIEIDVSGKKEGRGAYICPTLECLEKALKNKQLEHTLKRDITPANRECLAENVKELLKELRG
jgi:predicted RNA-binding protein YlxR (DUF448 family)